MKSLIFALMMSISIPVLAGGPQGNRHNHVDGRHYTHGHWRHSHSGQWEWVVPAIIGGVIVYQASRPPAPPPVIVQQETVVGERCSPWTEVLNGDGSITRTRTCTK